MGISLRLQEGIGFFYRPIPVMYCICLTTNLPSATMELYRLNTFHSNNRIWVRCCLYTGSSTSMCLYLTYLHPGFIPFGQSVSSTFTLSSMTVRQRQFTFVHHTIQANTFWNVAILRVVCSRQLHTRRLLSTHVSVGYS